LQKTLAIALCDNGYVDSKFLDGLLSIIVYMNSANSKINFDGLMHVSGSQIAQQRQNAIDSWYREAESDMLLWIDSDVVITVDAFKRLIDLIDETDRPIVSGVYFISPNQYDSMMTPYPAIFTDDGERNTSIHPLPENKIIQIDAAGFGLLLMHRSAVKKLIELEDSLFDVSFGKINLGEDISFFRKAKKNGIPVYADTGALVSHMKRFSFDVNYYKNWWINK
jgi:GT2 family glycosyltransferase